MRPPQRLREARQGRLVARDTERSKQARLEAILARHDGYEKRTLADLRVAGYAFATIAAARGHLGALRTMAKLNRTEIAELIRSKERNNP